MSHIATLTAQERRALAWASRDRLEFGRHLRPIVTVGRDEWSRDDLVSCTYGGDDGWAMLAQLTFRRRVPRDIEQKILKIEFEVDLPRTEVGHGLGPVRLPAFEGYALRRRDRGFALTAATGGYEAERTPLGRNQGQDVEIGGWPVDRALFHLLQPLRRRYRGMEVGPFDKPLIYKMGPERLTWNLYVKEPVEELAEAARAVMADTPTNVAYAYPMRAIDRDEPPAWHFEKGVDAEEIGDETPEGERFARVVVHTEPDDQGRVRYLAEAEVDNKGYDVFGGSTLMHPLDPEVELDTAGMSAWRLARTLARNDTEISVEPNYPPFFLRRGDTCSATGKDFRLIEGGKGAGSSARPYHSPEGGPRGILSLHRYLFRVQAMQVDALAMTGEVSGEGIYVGREEQEMSLPEFDRGGMFTPYWGHLPDTTSPFFDTDLPWVRAISETEAEIDTVEAARHGVHATQLENGTWEFTDEEE